MEQLGFKLVLIWNASIIGNGLTSCGTVSVLICFKDLFIHLKDKVTEMETHTHKKIKKLTIPGSFPPNVCNGWCCTRLEAGAWTPSGSPMGIVGAKAFGPSSTVFPGILAQSYIRGRAGET